MEQEQKGVVIRKFAKIGRKPIILSCAVFLIGAALVLNFVLFNKPAAPTENPEEPEPQEQAEPTVQEDGYYSAVRVSRQRARDEAIETWQTVLESENISEDEKKEVLAEMTELGRNMEAEANIETLVCAKGFSQCVAVIKSGECTVVVNKDELETKHISQIKEIVLEQAGIKPTHLKINAR